MMDLTLSHRALCRLTPTVSYTTPAPKPRPFRIPATNNTRQRLTGTDPRAHTPAMRAWLPVLALLAALVVGGLYVTAGTPALEQTAGIGPWIFRVTVLGILLVVGWQRWHAYRHARAEAVRQKHGEYRPFQDVR